MIKKRTRKQDSNQALARLIARAVKDSGLMGKRIAELCGVQPQAVSNWKTTGRIDKQNLEKLARLTGKSLDYFSTLPPESGFYRQGGITRVAHVAENVARYQTGKAPGKAGRKNTETPAKAAAAARRLAASIVRLTPEQRHLIEQLVEQLAAN